MTDTHGVQSDVSLCMVTSFAVQEKGLGAHIRSALAENLRNRRVSQLIIVSETAPDVLLAAAPELSHPKVSIRHSETRPTFGHLADALSQALSTKTVPLGAIMNADISFRTEADAERLIALSTELEAGTRSVALCLTRHDLVRGEPKITLRTQLDLPNSMSADAWFFAQPLELKQAPFYSLGQMFCDQFFNFDLISHGFEVFNPCLDCQIIHHEPELKELSYYAAETQTDRAQEAIKRHWRESVRHGAGHYFGIAHCEASALRRGYRPAPQIISEKGTRILAVYPGGLTPEHLRESIFHLQSAAERQGHDLYVISSDEACLREAREQLDGGTYNRTYVVDVQSPSRLVAALLEGREKHYTNAIIISGTTRPDVFDTQSFSNIVAVISEQATPGNPPVDLGQPVPARDSEEQYRLIQLHEPSESVVRVLTQAITGGAKLVVHWARDYTTLRNRATPAAQDPAT
ncbi:MAG: hypothetical protein R3E86_09360 [Pseudomonadales bacterium]